MLKIVMIGVMLLTSCHDVTGERCVLDTRSYLADCHQYRISNGFVGRVTPTETHDLLSKDKYVCVPPELWGEIYIILKEELATDNFNNL